MSPTRILYPRECRDDTSITSTDDDPRDTRRCQIDVVIAGELSTLCKISQISHCLLGRMKTKILGRILQVGHDITSRVISLRPKYSHCSSSIGQVVQPDLWLASKTYTSKLKQSCKSQAMLVGAKCYRCGRRGIRTEEDLQAILEPLEIKAAVLAHGIDDDWSAWLIRAIVEPIELVKGRIGVRSIFCLVLEVIDWHREILLGVLPCQGVGLSFIHAVLVVSSAMACESTSAVNQED